MRVIICVTNDLTTDQRVHKVAMSLQNKMQYDVLLVGRRFRSSERVQRPYSTRRFRLLFNHGSLFYAFFNIRLFIFLLFSKFDIVLSNDLDTLPACTLAKIIKKKKLVYDSHELFTEVPELINRAKVKSIWEWIEQKCIPKVSRFYTVAQPIADIYAEKYQIPVQVVRNVPYYRENKDVNKFDKPTLIYQGALNKGRGLELMIETMAFLPGFQLIICGSGYMEKKLQKQVELNSIPNVEFTGHKDFEELKKLTPKAHIGLSWEENLGKNYYYALPNKLFDYIQARIPALVSALPSMEKIVTEYQVGEVLKNRKPEKIANQIKELYDKQYTFEERLHIAAGELCWENEQHKLIEIFND